VDQFHSGAVDHFQSGGTRRRCGLVQALRLRGSAKVISAMRQELWGIAIAYNLVHREMERVAEAAGVRPTRISFVNALF
jgi:hypothetical protein